MKVGIIGAGPSGLVLAKELREVGIEVSCYEKASSFGGVFRATYEDAQFTSSNYISAFSDFGLGGEAPRYWYFKDYLKYLQRFVDKFQLEDSLHFNTEVITVKKAGESYRFVIRDLDSGKVFEETFDRVGMTTGTHQMPNIPADIDGFEGDVVHSKDYRSGLVFEGKRVLVIGGGESASDLCLNISRVAKETNISIRGKHGVIIPRMLPIGVPADFDTTRTRNSLPIWFGGFYSFLVFLSYWVYGSIGVLRTRKDSDQRKTYQVYRAFSMGNIKNHCNSYTKFGTKNLSMMEAMVKHGCTLRPGIRSCEGHRVTFVDGSVLECDCILLATGYRNRFSFLDEDFPSISTAATVSRNLYKHVFHPDLGMDIAWCGFARPAFGSVLPMSEMQARWIAQLWVGNAQLPKPGEMKSLIEKDADREMKIFRNDAGRITSLTDYLSYLEDIAALIGCKAPLWELFWRDHPVWWHVMIGPITGVQYRLAGPGSRDSARDQIRQTPIVWMFGVHLVLMKGIFSLLSLTRLPCFQPLGRRYR